MKELFLGGARSGKSRLAETAAVESGMHLVYIATGQAGDEEMAERIEHHREQRGGKWHLVEEPYALADVLKAQAKEDSCILVDCLTLWLSNCLLAEEESGNSEYWASQKKQLLNCLSELPGKIVFVSNEVGMGIVPMGELSRRFVDESGRLHQNLAEACDKVTFVIAGLPQVLKG